jgi:hypothetical protein
VRLEHVSRDAFVLAQDVAATFVAEPVAATVPSNGPLPARDANSPRRSLSAIQVDIHAALRAEAVTRRRGQNAAEVVRLIILYREMATHPQRDKSAMLAKLGLRLRSRLEKVCDHIERKYAQMDRGAKRKEIPSTLALPESNVLAQQVAVQAGGAFGQAAQPGADATIDYGPELVELIQQTISPATWSRTSLLRTTAWLASAGRISSPRRAALFGTPSRTISFLRHVLIRPLTSSWANLFRYRTLLAMSTTIERPAGACRIPTPCF